MKILLLNAPPLKTVGITGQIYPPLGILYLASYVRQHLKDIEIKAIDGYQENTQKIIKRILKYKPEILGVSFTTQAATGAYYLINEIKKLNKNITVVTGGAHPTILPDETFKLSNADLVVVGEGEITFCEIVEKVMNNEDTRFIDGTFHKENGKIIRNKERPFIKDLDSIPFPARDLLDINEYPGYMYKKLGFDTSIISARGCPYNCIYCSNPVWKSQRPWFRLRSPKNFVDEIEFIVKNYGIREFFDETDEFNGNLKWAKEVCDEIIQRDLNISWKAQMRVDHVDEELADKLKKSGFWMGLFGLESANNKTLKGIKKQQTVDQVESTLDILKKFNIKCFGLFMAFNVWEENGKIYFEDKEDSMNTLKFVKKLLKEHKLHLFGWSMTTPYPGSELYNIAIKHNLISKNYIGNWEVFDSGSNFVMNLPGVNRKDWISIMNSGKRLQARLLITSGTFNLSALSLYAKKLISLISFNLMKRDFKETGNFAIQAEKDKKKILLVNNFYYDRGGDCTYLFSLKKLLEEKGHKVIVFSMHHPKNFVSEYSKYFVSFIDYEAEISNINPSSGFKVLRRTIFSTEAKKKIKDLIKKEKPDIVHLQNIHHHITPSIFHLLKRKKIPIIWTLHDYVIICPNLSFLNQGIICEKCKKTKFFWAPLLRCKKDSFLASTVAATEITLHRILKIYDLVDVFICPSNFLRNKFIEFGFKEEKLISLGYLVDIDCRNNGVAPSDYCLFVGRISEEKGLKTLIDAIIKVNSVKLKIVGDGQLKEELILYTNAKDKNKLIEFLGHKRQNKAIELIENCKFVVVPSEWYENFPYVILETFACGKTVIGSRIGGIPELIKDNETGLTFEPCDSEDLSLKIKYLRDNPDKAVNFGKNAEAFIKQELNADKHYQKLMEIYEKAALEKQTS